MFCNIKISSLQKNNQYCDKFDNVGEGIKHLASLSFLIENHCLAAMPQPRLSLKFKIVFNFEFKKIIAIFGPSLDFRLIFKIVKG